MELLTPQDFQIDAVTSELISDAKALAEVVNQNRPIASEALDRINAELLGGRVYNSNSIEGNTLDLRETRRILETGMTVPVDKRREAAEVINLGKAIREVEGIVHRPELWSDLETFLRIHKTLLSGIDDGAAGVLRSQNVMISGAKFQPPDSSEVRHLIDKAFRSLGNSSDLEPIVLATWLHWAIARIHPFLDGNGRMARLWQDVVLFGHQLTTAIIPVESRGEYYSALTDADAGNLNPLAQLVTRSLNHTLQIYVNAQRESDEIRDWATSIVGEADARVAEKLKLDYLRWTRKFEGIRDAFERCAVQITNASSGAIEIRLKPFEIINQSTWETLRAGGHASKTWYFWLNFRKQATRFQYCFFFGTHFSTEEDSVFDISGGGACLLVSEQQGAENAIPLYESTESPITLRELFVSEEKLVRKRFDMPTGRLVYDKDVDPITVAKEFVQEVLLKRMS